MNNRRRELAILDRLWHSNHAEFLILFGRRQVGKTALITQWVEQTGNRSLYWSANNGTAFGQLPSFSQTVYNLGHPNCPAPASFAYLTWEQAWEEIIRLAEKDRLALFIDDFTNLLDTTPSIAGKLQNFWDHHFKNSNVFLCILGSHPGIMERKVFSYRAPLYGRASAILHLRPLTFGITRDCFPSYSAADRVAIYAMFGGIPAYWERLDPQLPVADNLRRNLFTEMNLNVLDPTVLLQGLDSAPHRSLSVLAAIVSGAYTAREIVSDTGLSSPQVFRCITALRDAGFVERRISVTSAPNSRTGRYSITDPYLRFYSRFLLDSRRQLALGLQEQVLTNILCQMDEFIRTYTWKELCYEWLVRASGKGNLPVIPEIVGSAWNEEVEVDVAGIDRIDKTLVLGACEWSLQPADWEILSDLVEKKARSIVPRKEVWQVFFLGFSRSGWTQAARQYADDILRKQANFGNLQVMGIRLLDLTQIDQDLTQWGEPAVQEDDIPF